MLNRPPPKYKGYVPLNTPEKFTLGIGSAVSALWNLRRGGTVQLYPFSCLRTNFNSVDLVGSLAEVTAGPFIKYLRDAMLADETGRRILYNRPRINSKTLPVGYLRGFLENTFRRYWADYLDQYRITLDIRDNIKYIDDKELAYVIQRYQEGYNYGHVLTSLPTAFVKREVALKAFEFINTSLPITGLSLVAVIKLKPEERSRFFNIYLL